MVSKFDKSKILALIREVESDLISKMCDQEIKQLSSRKIRLTKDKVLHQSDLLKTRM